MAVSAADGRDGGGDGATPEAAGSPATAAVAAPRQRDRALSISANLLPEEIIALRRVKKCRSIVIVSLVVLVAGIAGWYGIARYQTATASRDLATAEDGYQRLTRQQSTFTTLIKVQGESQTIKSELKVLMAEDLPWSRLIASLAAASPEGVAVTAVTASLTSAANGSGQNGGGLPRDPGKKVIGNISIKATAASKAAIAEYVDALGRVKGLASPLLSDMNLQESALRFTVRLEITSDALGGRYASSGDRKAGQG